MEAAKSMDNAIGNLPVAAFSEQLTGKPYSIDREHYLYGDEQSVCGRCANDALGNIGGGGQGGNDIHFGDFKIAGEGKGRGRSKTTQSKGDKRRLPCRKIYCAF